MGYFTEVSHTLPNLIICPFWFLTPAIPWLHASQLPFFSRPSSYPLGSPFQISCLINRLAETRRQTGIGTEQDPQQAMKYYRQAAEGGDRRAQKRLQNNNRGGMSALDRRLEMEAMKEDRMVAKDGKGDGCVVM